MCIKLKFGSIWALYSFVTRMNWVQFPARVKRVQFNLIFFVIFLFIYETLLNIHKHTQYLYYICHCVCKCVCACHCVYVCVILCVCHCVCLMCYFNSILIILILKRKAKKIYGISISNLRTIQSTI